MGPVGSVAERPLHRLILCVDNVSCPVFLKVGSNEAEIDKVDSAIFDPEVVRLDISVDRLRNLMELSHGLYHLQSNLLDLLVSLLGLLEARNVLKEVLVKVLHDNEAPAIVRVVLYVLRQVLQLASAELLHEEALAENATRLPG